MIEKEKKKLTLNTW